MERHVLEMLSAMHRNEKGFLLYYWLKGQFNESEFHNQGFVVRFALPYVLWVTWHEADTQPGRGEMRLSSLHPTKDLTEPKHCGPRLQYQLKHSTLPSYALRNPRTSEGLHKGTSCICLLLWPQGSLSFGGRLPHLPA